MFTEARISIGKNATSPAANQRRHRTMPLNACRKKATSELGPVAWEDFEELISNGVALITFHAAWCAPCRQQEPVVDELAEIYREKATVAKMIIDQNQFLAMQLGIQSIPTTILYREGRELDRYIGFQTMETLEQVLTHALSPNPLNPNAEWR